MSTLKLSNIVSQQGTGNVAVSLGTNDQVTFTHAVSQPGGFSFRNKIINGEMVIDQRNLTAAVTPTIDNTYTLDRWSIRNYGGNGRFSVQRVSSTIQSFPYRCKLTVTTTDTPGTYGYAFSQRIEGNNIKELGYGTNTSKTITISFWVNSSITGTYCLSIRNTDGTRSYVTEFNISASNTDEFKTITIPGDTTGTWNIDSTAGMLLEWNLGGQTSKTTSTTGSWINGNYINTSSQTSWISNSGATFYLTGVQLEVGEVATPFEHRQIATEVNLCTRYFYRMGNGVNNFLRYAIGDVRLSTEINGVIYLPNVMRGTPTATISSVSHFAITEANTNRTVTSFGISTMPANLSFVFYNASVASGLTPGRCAQLISNNTQSSFIDFSAEL